MTEDGQGHLTDEVRSELMARPQLTEEQLARLHAVRDARSRAHAAVHEANAELARVIVEVHGESKASLQAIGQAVGLTKQRIDQILQAAKPAGTQVVEDRLRTLVGEPG